MATILAAILFLDHSKSEQKRLDLEWWLKIQTILHPTNFGPSEI